MPHKRFTIIVRDEGANPQKTRSFTIMSIQKGIGIEEITKLIKKYMESEQADDIQQNNVPAWVVLK